MKLKFALFILVLIFITELALRLFGFCDAPLYYVSSQYEYMYLPNQNRMRFGNEIFINEHSMRSRPLNPKDSIRFLLIGDSVIDGGVMTTHDSLAATILERKLSGFFKIPIRVLNLAAKSWGPDNASAFIKEYGDFDASLICLVFSSHDIYDNMTFEPTVGISPDHPENQYPLAIIELFDRYLIPRYLVKFFQKEDNLDFAKNLNENKTFNTGWRFFIDYCKEKQIEMMVYLHADLNEFKQDRYFQDTIVNLLNKENVTSIFELDTELKENYYADEIHFNDLGQKHIATVLYPEFSKEVSKMMSQ